ncbi:hypothetical protein D3C85_1615610 [compost metagenome]
MLHLTENLCLPKHHGIQPTGYTEQMTDGLFVFVYIQMLCKLIPRDTEPLLHKAANKIPAHMQPIYHHIDFRTIAGSYNNTLKHTLREF